MQPIPKRASRCLFCEVSFEAGSIYVSALESDKNRADYCLTCWQSQGKKTKERSFWRGKIPLKIKKNMQLDHRALELIRSLSDPKIRFVLALYLQRKRQLVRRTHLLYEIPSTGEIFEIQPMIFTSQEGESIGQIIEELYGYQSTSH